MRRSQRRKRVSVVLILSERGSNIQTVQFARHARYSLATKMLQWVRRHVT